MTQIVVALSLAAIGAGTRELRAQCPDGSPPPCRGATIATASRRVNPPLDDRTWIVVPFDNVSKNEEVEWLRGGSVNLLYLGMSRWTDVRVIDDERVADFIRDVPEANGGKTLSLNAGLAVAKRAGAGKLVMGDVLKLGSQTSVTAKVFDVKTGQRVRSVREQTAIQDSVMTMFGKLAQRILNVAPRAGANSGGIGTTSIAAFQEYALGMQALNVFDITNARAHLERALQLDSTFALAHARLSVLGGWDAPNDPANRAHAEAAARLASSLPPRERALIQAQVAFARRQYATACGAFSALIRNDSTDVDAWYGLGDCFFHDDTVEVANGDTTRMRWRGDMNASVQAFRRALEIDPTYHLAYQHIVDAYSLQFRTGRYCATTPCTVYVGIARQSGDSVLLVPVAMPRDTALYRLQVEEYLRRGMRRRGLARAEEIAAQWVSANPQEDRARLMHATVLLYLGKVTAADSELARISSGGGAINVVTTAMNRLETTIKLWNGLDANRRYDALRTSTMSAGMGPGGRTITVGAAVLPFAPVLGRLSGFDSLLAAQLTPAQLRMTRPILRVALGVPADSAVAMERSTFDQTLAGRGPRAATLTIAASLWFGVRLQRASWPALDTSVTDAKLQPAIALSRGDTARLRLAARRLDSLSALYVIALAPDTGAALVAADAYLLLRDSLAALQMTRRTLDSIVPYTSMTAQTTGTQIQVLLPRAMVLRADLAAALGYKDEARVWYKRFLDLWSKADPEFQPLLDRIKTAYAALGSG